MSKPFNMNITNDNGTVFRLTEKLPDYLIQYTGLNPPAMTMLSAEQYNLDGAYYQGSRAQTRNIVLTAYIFNNVTASRLELYDAFRVGHEVKVEYWRTENISASYRWIYGVVESIECPQFEEPSQAKQIMQISIICYDPWLRNYPHDLTDSVGPDHRMTIFSASEWPTTMEVKITAAEEIHYPELWLEYEGTTQRIGLYATMQTGDVLTVDTGKKTIILTSGGTDTNLINAWERGSEWLKLYNGRSYFYVTGLDGALREQASGTVDVLYYDLYQGV